MSDTARPRSLASLKERHEVYARMAERAGGWGYPHAAAHCARIRDDLARRIAEHPESSTPPKETR